MPVDEACGEHFSVGLSDVKNGWSRVASDASTCTPSDSDEDSRRCGSADDSDTCTARVSQSDRVGVAARDYLVTIVALILSSSAVLAFLQLPKEVQAALLGFGIVWSLIFFVFCHGSMIRASGALILLLPMFMVVIALVLAMMTPPL
eukprot:CAMPEP_0172691918 /NCGR_PEP_ID=MMETSP1074-20121228/24876_1 /TAXON_ID=2916 /ORGANISM="Ceratium fusus, Strain PA161109" /LENGTH=146 /DNA_ID=CAMNT_0013512031 /DNA_START=39 /DNA_END=479 /DNA_ORIENTATION=-